MTSTTPDGGQTPLTAALLADLLTDADTLAADAHRLLAPIAQARDEMRDRLQADQRILTLPTTGEPPHSMCAVDGGSVREPLYAADLLVAVAASADAMSANETRPLQHRHWATLRQHTPGNEKLLSAAMASLELDLLASLDHEIRILDGAYRTPLLAMWLALTTTSPAIQNAVADLITPTILDAATMLCDPAQWTGTIIALPKSDSGNVYTEIYRRDYGLTLPGGDRFLAAQVLQPGEMLHPRHTTEYTGGGFGIADNPDRPAHIQRACDALQRATEPLGQAARNGTVLTTYIKPATADTVVKLEYRPAEPLPADTDPSHPAVTEGLRLGQILSQETPGPFLQEPYAQYAVDLAAKSVAVGAEALNQAMLANLPDGSDRYLPLLVRSYRTATR